MFTLYEFDPLNLSFLIMGPSFPQNPWVPFYAFQKSVGSAEPTEPTLTTPLLRATLVKRISKY